jgi:hypothetical protein
MNGMTDALEAMLALLPECHCDIASLETAAVYFGLSEAEIQMAAAELPKNHDLCYRGVRRLLSLCIEEFADIFGKDDRSVCEVSVPAPVCLLFAAQAANNTIRFFSQALFAQIVLRGIFLNREALDLSSCSKRHCGLNRMRRRLVEMTPKRAPEYMLQFSVLCDECGKVGEMCGEKTKCLSFSFPKKIPERTLALDRIRSFITDMCELTKTEIGHREELLAFKLYGRLMKAENTLSELNTRKNSRPLMGNSLALAQSVQLMTTGRAEAFVSALEELVRELKNAPCKDRGKRIYCFFIPFLQPEIDRRFRDNGVSLVGGGAFLYRAGVLGSDMAGVVLNWLDSMSIRTGTQAECQILAEDMARYGCRQYLTGSFGFDRWIGATGPMQRRLLQENFQIQTILLDVDFWSENAMFGNMDSRIDGICSLNGL